MIIIFNIAWKMTSQARWLEVPVSLKNMYTTLAYRGTVWTKITETCLKQVLLGNAKKIPLKYAAAAF